MTHKLASLRGKTTILRLKTTQKWWVIALPLPSTHQFPLWYKSTHQSCCHSCPTKLDRNVTQRCLELRQLCTAFTTRQTWWAASQQLLFPFGMARLLKWWWWGSKNDSITKRPQRFMSAQRPDRAVVAKRWERSHRCCSEWVCTKWEFVWLAWEFCDHKRKPDVCFSVFQMWNTVF